MRRTRPPLGYLTLSPQPGHRTSVEKRLTAATMATVFAGAIAASVYVILDMEYPRLGLIRVDDFDRLLTEVLAGMK